MKKEFVPYELALRLKTLGFDEPCFGYYDTDGLQVSTHYWYPENKNTSFPESQTTNNPKISAPTFSQAFRWFREKHNLFSYIELFTNEDNIEMYEFIIYSNQVNPLDAKDCFTYEEAEYYCLNKLIELTFKSE